MKFFKTRNLVLTGAVLAVVGIILFFSGFAMGGFSSSITFKDGGFQVVKNKSLTETKTLNSDIKKLTINVEALKVSVKTGDEFSVKSQLNGRTLDVTRSGDTAVISTSDHRNDVQIFSFNFGNDDSLVITVPDKKQLKELQLELDASRADVDDLELTKLSGELSASSLTSNKLAINSLNFQDVEASHLTFSGLQLKTSGRIDMEASHLRIKNSQIPVVTATGEASSLKINGQHKELPILLADTIGIPGNLHLDMDASSTTITDSTERTN